MPTAIQQLADYYCQNFHFARDEGKLLYRYHNGVYLPDGEDAVLRRLELYVEALALRGLRPTLDVTHEILAMLANRAPNLQTKPDTNLINLANGVYNLYTGRLESHSPEILTPIQIPIAHDPQAKSPAWDSFLAQVLDYDLHPLLWEIIGYCLVADTAQNKAFLLEGPGGTGKSTFLKVLSAFFGPGQIAGLSLYQLVNSHFATSGLYGKLVNISSEMPPAAMQSMELFQALVSGDPIVADRKYRQPIMFAPYARFWFAANEPPVVQYSTRAYKDRWIVLPFERRFRGQRGIEQNQGQLVSRLSRAEELSGALNQAIAGLNALQGRGYFQLGDKATQALDAFAAASIPFETWASEHLREGGTVAIAAKAMLDSYNAWASEHELPSLNATAFGRNLRQRYPGVESTNMRVGGKQAWVWRGVTFTE